MKLNKLALVLQTLNFATWGSGGKASRRAFHPLHPLQNFRFVVLVGLMIGSLLISTRLVMAQENELTPVETQQNDVRSSVAKINPKKPIQIRVVSQTNVPVVAMVVSVTDDRVVAPGASVVFGRLHTSYLSLPINMQVSLQEAPDPTKPIRLFLDIKISGNEIIVGVKTSLTGSGNSSQSVSVDKNGLIYVY